MDEQDYLRNINSINNQINSKNSRLSDINSEISEHEEALQNINKTITKFDSFVNSKKSRISVLSSGNPMRALLGLKKNIDSKLNGRSYVNSKNGLENDAKNDYKEYMENGDKAK